MTDIVDRKTRSRMMSGIRGKDTKPEKTIRSGLHRAGFRYRVHSPRISGKPDIYLRKYNAIVLVHGCLWHRHGCHLFKWPRGEDPEFWRKKLEKNAARDRLHLENYRAAGKRVAIIWECALKGKYRMHENDAVKILAKWLRGNERFLEVSSIDPQFEKLFRLDNT